ncbi:MAG: hypothetical protein UZ05_CHB002000270 [Chlorobi bacterium OLB5]|nr:MAG: hypothetical protein UZ05_CHB002000270 [Chlorobi bacterium OLB5]
MKNLRIPKLINNAGAGADAQYLADSVLEFTNARIDKNERSVVFTLITDKFNRNGWKFRADGIKLENYKKNPLVLFNHGPRDFLGIKGPDTVLNYVIGNSPWQNVEGTDLVCKAIFNKRPFSQDVWNSVVEGDLPAWSAGMNPIEPYDDTMIRNETDGTIDFLQSELVEISKVLIPADPDAVNNMLGRAKTTEFKNFLVNEFSMNMLKSELESLKTELTNLKNAISKEGEYISKAEAESIVISVCKKYDKIYAAKFTEIVGQLKNLQELKVNNLKTSINEMVTGAISTIKGKV